MLTLADLDAIAPEITLAVTLGLVLVLDLLFRPAERRLTGWLALSGVTLAASQIVKNLAAAAPLPSAAAGFFSGMFVADSTASFFKLIFCLAAAGAVVIGYRSSEISRARHGEYHFLLLAATLGMCFMASAGDLVMVYLAVEMLSQASYILAGYIRNNPRSSEGALKYVIYGGVASGAMIFGISILYGFTGVTDLVLVGQGLAGTASSPAALMAFLFMLVGLGFKVAMVPFHMWAPDVYEGAPAPVTAFLSIGSKAAGFAVLLRVLFSVGAQAAPGGGGIEAAAIPWREMLAVLAVLTMTVGNLSAIGQRSLKRLLAFSSVGHAGYLLAACTTATASGVSSILFYFVVYFLMTLGAFHVVVLVSNATGRDSDADYAGLGWKQPFLAATMSIFLVSLVGLPPTAGFLGKWYLFTALVEMGSWKFLLLTLAALLNSVISLYYYVYIIKKMWIEEPAPEGRRVVVGFVPGILLAVLAFLTVYPFGYGGAVLAAASKAAGDRASFLR